MSTYRHSHRFDTGNPLAERRTCWAVALTVLMMVGEILGGWWYNSMALLADGWHMSSHALALGLAVFSYRTARRYAGAERFCFGTWKIEVLGGFASALLLLGVAALMLWQSAWRLWQPGAIHYDQAIAIAVIGLLVNLVCAWLLRDDHHHHHHHHGDAHHHHDHHDHHHDLNQRAAFLHVLADAATSALAIVALLAGKWWGAAWLDPVMGIVGAVMVALWARGLLRETGRVLLDAEMDAPLVAAVRQTLATLPEARLVDLHLWRVGRQAYACIVALESERPLACEQVHRLLAQHGELLHVTVQTQRRWRSAGEAKPLRHAGWQR